MPKRSRRGVVRAAFVYRDFRYLAGSLTVSQVGGMALADPAGVEADAGRQGDRRAGSVHHHPVVAAVERRGARRCLLAVSRSQLRS
jgi:hypothetical protein